VSLTDCVELLEILVAHPTINPGGEERALAAVIAERLEGLNADSVEVVEVPRGSETGAYVWATYGKPDTLVNIHLDTVPVASGWTRDPFRLERGDGGLLYGLGSADTKGAIACLLTALADRTPENLAVLISGDEEVGTTCMDAFVGSDRTDGLRRAIVCEPTRRCAGIRHRGMRAYKMHIAGVGGHSSLADRLPKPLVTGARLAIELDQLGERYLEEHQQAGQRMAGLCLNIAGIDGGVAFNVIPQRGELTFSIRPPPGFDAERFEGEIGTCLRTVSDDVSVETMLARDGFATRDRQGFSELLGDYPADWVDLDFWTEAAMLAAVGIDAVVIGPGDIGVAHAPDEHVSAADLEWAIAMFTSVLAGAASHE
jgi:acetylornithine deacetylase